MPFSLASPDCPRLCCTCTATPQARAHTKHTFRKLSRASPHGAVCGYPCVYSCIPVDRQNPGLYGTSLFFSAAIDSLIDVQRSKLAHPHGKPFVDGHTVYPNRVGLAVFTHLTITAPEGLYNVTFCSDGVPAQCEGPAPPPPPPRPPPNRHHTTRRCLEPLAPEFTPWVCD